MYIHYKNRRKAKRFLSIIWIILLCILSGCQSEKISNDTNRDQITSTPKDQIEPTIAMEESEDSNDVDFVKDNTENREIPNIEDFSNIDLHFKDYTFDLTYDENLIDYERIYSIQGEYDLDGDGKLDKINAILKRDNTEGTYIEVNGTKAEVDPCGPTGELKIIDLDTRDSYVEVAIVNGGLDSLPGFIFYQYDGKEVYCLGSIESGSLIDGQGKFISWYDLADNFKPQFFSAWGEFKRNSTGLTNHDVEQYIGKTYEVNGKGYFVPLESNPENFDDYLVWDFDEMIDFKETKVKLLDIHIRDDRTLNYFYVELENGEKGLMYFYIGP